MYTWIGNTFGIGDGLARGLAFAVALAVVLALFALFVFIIKRLAGARSMSVRSRQPRLAIMDSASVDTRRRLVLIRRDNIEHLLLIGGPSDVVVEQGIVRGTPLASGHPRQQAAFTNGNSQMPNIEGMAASVPVPATPLPNQPFSEQAAPAPAAVASPVEAPRRAAPASSAPPSGQSPAAPPPPAETAPQAPVARAAASSGDATVSSLRSRIGDLTRSPGQATGKPETQPSRTGGAISAFSRTLSAIKPQDTGKKEETSEPGKPERREPLVARTPSAAAGTRAPQPPQTAGQTAERQAGPASAEETPAAVVRPVTKPIQNRPAAPGSAGPARTVTPPSSGPAARALTAFPLGGSEGRKEPVMAEKPKPAVAPAPEAGTSSTPPADATPAATGAKADRPAPEKAPSEKTMTEEPPALPETEKPVVPEKADKPEGTSLEAPAGDKADASPAKPDAAGSPIGDKDSAEEAPSTTSGQKAPDKVSEKASESASDVEITEEDGRPVEQGGEAPSRDAATSAGDDAGGKAEDAKQDDRQPTQDAETNPIEDEMAKLLDEIHGNQKA